MNASTPSQDPIFCDWLLELGVDPKNAMTLPLTRVGTQQEITAGTGKYFNSNIWS